MTQSRFTLLWQLYASYSMLTAVHLPTTPSYTPNIACIDMQKDALTLPNQATFIQHPLSLWVCPENGKATPFETDSARALECPRQYAQMFYLLAPR